MASSRDPSPAPSPAPSAASRALPDWLLGDTRPRWKRPATWLVLAAVVAVLAGAWAWQQAARRDAAPRYVTEPVTRGDIALTVSADGTLRPTRSANIGSELSGTVAEVLVDVNDRVAKGQVLVRLDTTKFADQVEKSRAAVRSAEAAADQASASTLETRVALARLKEVQRLSGGRLPAATELDTASAAVAKAEAAEANARAAVSQAKATLRTDETNLAKASIRAPFDGVILTRAVEPGNAVAASLQAVTLFTMAQDLRQLELVVNVDEADVGQLQAGQAATFAVSAWPGRRYPSQVTRVNFGSTTTDNVVTYPTQLRVDNPDLSLRPGMTATATIAATQRTGVLRVPHTAFSFDPTAAVAPAGGGSGGGIVSSLMPRPPGGQTAKRARPAEAGKDAAGATRRLWVLDGGQPRAIQVTAGLSNGRLTEVSGPEVAEGQQVIVDQQAGGGR